jgi:hypothetical protein
MTILLRLAGTRRHTSVVLRERCPEGALREYCRDGSMDRVFD